MQFLTKKNLLLYQFKVNDILIDEGKNYEVRSGAFLSYYLGSKDKKVTLSFYVNLDQNLDLTLNEISYDLLTNKKLSIKPRAEDMMPMPFVTNDAIIIGKQISL